MPKNLLTFALEGDVDLLLFPEAMSRFRDLVQTLTEEIAGQTPVTWSIDSLEAGSAVITVRGQAEEADVVERVVTAYATIGKALEKQQPIPYSDRVKEKAHAITGILDGKVTTIRFETPDETSVVSTQMTLPRQQVSPTLHAFGAIRGQVDTLARRRGYRFILYESINDRAVTCYMRPEQEQMMRETWGKRVVVHGWISRDPYTGLPLSIRDIQAIEPLPDFEAGAYMSARGAVPWDSTFPLPEDAIRRAGDGH